MSRIITAGVLIVLLVSAMRANSQQPVSIGRAPVPRQVLDAHTIFIGNGGGESFGAESYYSRTKYDGGPNRPYEAFYAAMRDWGHYDIVGSTDAADVALVIKFSSPIVDREVIGAGRNESSNLVYDPQLNVSINDPRTGIQLWTITEHIEPGSNREDDNRHFDEAIGRLINDLRRLILMPERAASENDAPPPGTQHVIELHRHARDMSIGILLGGVIGEVLGSRSLSYSCPAFPTTLTLADLNAPPPDLSCDAHYHSTKLRNEFLGTIGGSIIGGLLGWIFPVSF